ncbi:MAG: acyltransferase [Salinibacter sp.]
MSDAAAFVHASSYVDQNVDIGSGTRIWHFCHISEGARIGQDCVFGQNVFVGRHVAIGNGVKIQNNVSVYEGVELEDGVFCGPSMVFTNVRNPRSEIERKDEFEATLVRQGATLGANCTILCGHTVGRYALVAAGAVVTHDVPNYGLMVGVPAKRIGWVCECGHRLDFDDDVSCIDCGRSYHMTDAGEIIRIG